MGTGITTAPGVELFEALPIINLLMERVSRLRRSYRATFEFFVGTVEDIARMKSIRPKYSVSYD
jgi:hypothetical protein